MKIAVNDIEINVKDQGGGAPAVVFLHYWGGSSRTWDAVIAALPPSYRTVAPDLRGWGDSEAPATGYALADFADDAQQMIAKLGLREYVLIGHSMGGKIAQLLASRRPSGLVGLVLVAPATPTPLALPPEARAGMKSAYLSRESIGMALDHMLTAKPLSAALREQVIEDSMRGAPQAREAWPESTSREDISSLVGAIEVPVAVVAGELDKVDSVDILKAELLPRISQAKLHVLAGTGHLSPLESPAEVAAAIVGFIQSTKAGA
ncbi:alpha/beta fold hydrolase [Duganella hordei]|uniref:alpha/beta fold hydrolase n=1 Tax=Duganella hordei TaxID=2865934 RepID=UPI0030E7F176